MLNLRWFGTSTLDCGLCFRTFCFIRQWYGLFSNMWLITLSFWHRDQTAKIVIPLQSGTRQPTSRHARHAIDQKENVIDRSMAYLNVCLDRGLWKWLKVFHTSSATKWSTAEGEVWMMLVNFVKFMWIVLQAVCSVSCESFYQHLCPTLTCLYAMFCLCVGIFLIMYFFVPCWIRLICAIEYT